MAAYKPWMTHTLFPYDVIFISDGKNTVENTQIWCCCVKIGEKWGIISGGKVQNGKRSTPLYRCFQRANFDTPHCHYEFCMRFWPAETDSHAVSHFMELCAQDLFKSSRTHFVARCNRICHENVMTLKSPGVSSLVDRHDRV